VWLASGTLSLPTLNLNAGYWDFFWPQFVQGISLGLLYVPLATTTLGGIPKQKMDNAAGVFNLPPNQVGGDGSDAAGEDGPRRARREERYTPATEKAGWRSASLSQ
jgi:hypothetical protein